MMNQGNRSAEKRRQASPFLNYALDKYNVTLEDVPSEHEGFETSSDKESSQQFNDTYAEKEEVIVDDNGNTVRTEVSPDNKA